MMWTSAAPKLYKKLFQEMHMLSDEEFKELLEDQLVECLTDTSPPRWQAPSPNSPNPPKPRKSADCSATAPGTHDADWLLGLDEAKLSDDVAAVAAAELRGGPGDDDAAGDDDATAAGNAAAAGLCIPIAILPLQDGLGS